MKVIRRVGPKLVVDEGNRVRVVTMFEGEDSITKTQQQFKDDTDVNKIMKKYKTMHRAVAELGHGRDGVFGDFTSFGSFEDSLKKVTEMRETFMQLPSDVRKRFGNDPQQLVEFLGDKDKVEESYKMGLRIKPESKADPVVEEVKGLREDMKAVRKAKAVVEE